MKVLHIIPSLKIGGAQKLVVDICKALNQYKDIDYRLIIFKNVVEFDTRELKVKFISTKFIPRIIFNPTKDTSELELFLKTFRPDIIHTHLWETEITIKSLTNLKCLRITHCHSNFPPLKVGKLFQKKAITNKYERMLFFRKNQNYFIAISSPNYDFMKSKLPKELRTRLSLIPNGIELPKLKKNSHINKLGNIKLIMVGSFVKEKNQFFAIKIFKEILKNNSNCTMTFLGNGPLLKNIIDYTNKLGLNEKIFFKGNVSNVNDFLEASNIYIHTAKAEAFGLSILEAMALGLPVVTLDGKGNRHFIKNGINGYCFEKEDVNLFADTILKLCKNPDLYLKISKNAIETARNFSIEAMTKEIVKMYYKLNKL